MDGGPSVYLVAGAGNLVFAERRLVSNDLDAWPKGNGYEGYIAKDVEPRPKRIFRSGLKVKVPGWTALIAAGRLQEFLATSSTTAGT